MSKMDLSERRQRIADFVRALENAGKPEALHSVGVVSRRLAGEMGLVETTARKYVLDAIGAGVLVEVRHEDRVLDFPWPEGVEFKPKRWAQGSVKRGGFWMTEEWQGGPAMTRISFVFTPERLKQVVDRAVEVDGEKALERAHRREQQEQRRTAERAEQAEVFAQRYPVLAELLERLDERVREPDDSESAVRVSARVHPQAGFIGQVYIQVPYEGFAELEAVLRDGLGKAVERGQEGSGHE